ncbi:MAG: hypothetical protein JXM73_15365 [Anaerolineae bacterium]|nr:hypothetical protein [Anaerolineae bacterium]
MIHVAVVNGHPHMAIALHALLSQTSDIRLVAEARRGSEAFALVQRERPPGAHLRPRSAGRFEA